MKVHYFSAEPREEEYVRERTQAHEVAFHTGSLTSEQTLSDPSAEAISIFIDSKIGVEELSRFPSLKLIATRSTGFDHIDLAAAKERGIAVSNVPFYGENTVAEFTFALILALFRRILDAHERVREVGSFSQSGLRGFDLAGKTIGVVGVGHIGVHVIRIAKGFDMQVITFDVHHDDALAARLGFSYASLEELLAKSDIISLHVPYNKHTHHLLSKSNIGKMKKGACLINTARGGVVETEALVAALRNGTIGAAGGDGLSEG